MTKFVARQGDLLFVEVDAVPENTKMITPVDQPKVLALGESTGHSHRVLDPDVEFVSTSDGRRLLLTPVGGASVVHEEHSTVTLPAEKTIEVILQTEYEPQALRYVLD